MIEVFPISMTQIDWGTYIRSVRDILNQSPTRQLDLENVDPKGPFGFIASIGAFKGDKSYSTKIASHAGFILRHFSFGFLIHCSYNAKNELASGSDLAIDEGYNGDISDIGLYLVSGNLFQWKQAIVQNLGNDSGSTEFRILLNTILGLLEQAGLVDLFKEFSKHPLIDKTFTLTKHR
jgi:hypothetical protein